MSDNNTSNNWHRIKQLFKEVSEKPVDEQEAYLLAAAGDDQELLKEIRQLLVADRKTDEPLAQIIAEAAADVNHSAKVDDYIQQYRIVELLGEGGMGQVYLAERADEQYQQQVAIKILGVRRPTEELVQRFRAERQILATLDHPNIARLLDGGETEDGAPFLVMEYVDGDFVDQYCDKKLLSTRERLNLFIKVCTAVDHAHRNLIIHRDIKPSNIMVGESGEPKLLDFGIAKLLQVNADVLQTRSGSRLLSPLHASPEQVKGKPVTIATDVYSLGVLLYQILTGQHPYQTDTNNPLDVERAICETEPVKPSLRLTQSAEVTEDAMQSIAAARRLGRLELSRLIRGDLDNIVLTALNKEPERRYASVRDFIADIQRFLEHRPVQARPSSLLYRTGKFLRRNRLPSAIAATAIIALATSIGLSVNRIAEERDIATAERNKAEAVNDFMQDIFKSANPDTARGEETTARELLAFGAKQINENLDDLPAVRATMLRVLGETYYALGETDRSQELLSSALNLLQNEPQLAIEELATIKLLLGFVQQDRSNWDEAENLINEARALREKHIGPENFDVVEVISAQAHLLEFQGELDLAVERFEEALSMARRLVDEDHEKVAEIMTKLAGVYRLDRQIDKARPLLQQSLAMQQRLYGDLHPQMSDTKRHLAALYRDTREFDKSEALYIEVIAERKKMLGPEHTEVAHTYNSYSQMLSDKGDLDGAVAASEEFMRIIEKINDEPVASFGAAYNNHALLQKNQGDYEGAIESLNKSIEVQDYIGMAKDHLHRSYPLYSLALVYLKQEEFAKAEGVLRQVVTMRQQHFDESHLAYSQVRNALCAALIGLDQLDEAETILHSVLKHLKEQQGDDHPETQTAIRRLEEIASRRLAGAS